MSSLLYFFADQLLNNCKTILLSFTYESKCHSICLCPRSSTYPVNIVFSIPGHIVINNKINIVSISIPLLKISVATSIGMRPLVNPFKTFSRCDCVRSLCISSTLKPFCFKTLGQCLYILFSTAKNQRTFKRCFGKKVFYE